MALSDKLERLRSVMLITCEAGVRSFQSRLRKLNRYAADEFPQMYSKDKEQILEIMATIKDMISLIIFTKAQIKRAQSYEEIYHPFDVMTTKLRQSTESVREGFERLTDKNLN